VGPLYPERFPIDEVLESLQLLKKRGYNIRLIIAARDWSQKDHWFNYIQNKSAKFKLQITILKKYLSVEQRVKIYNKADVVLFPFKSASVTRATDPPLTLLEAMSCGCVVVTTRNMSEVINNKNAVCLDSITPQNLAEALITAFDKDRRDQLTVNARKTILNKYSSRKIAKQLLRIYDDLLKSV